MAPSTFDAQNKLFWHRADQGCLDKETERKSAVRVANPDLDEGKGNETHKATLEPWC